MSPKLFILSLFLISSSLSAQTSVFTELVSNIFPDDYLLKAGICSEITISTTSNPNDDDRYTDKWIYEITNDSTYQGRLYRDNKLLSTKTLIIDSKNRPTYSSTNFKHRALGWERTIIRYKYSSQSKAMNFLDDQGNLKYQMIVHYDSINSPIRIVTLDGNNVLQAMSIVKYDYENGTFNNKILRADRSLASDQNEYYNPDYILEKNEYGDITKMSWPTAKKGSGVTHIVDYKYDRKGNWIKKTKRLITPDRKKVLSVVSRKIKYVN